MHARIFLPDKTTCANISVDLTREDARSERGHPAQPKKDQNEPAEGVRASGLALDGNESDVRAVDDISDKDTQVQIEAAKDLGPYMMRTDAPLRVYSVFDDLKYDRSDADMLSPGMRRHAVEKLAGLGFKQKSGSVLHNKTADVFCYLPKPQVLGASPFDVIRYTRKRDEDFVVLTPTQTACQMIDQYAYDIAVEKIIALVWKQPINLYRIFDYLEHKPAHQEIREALGFFKSEQRKAIQSEPLCRRRPL